VSKPHVVHVVCTDAFAGTERYVLNAALSMRAEGAWVSVVGGSEDAMRVPLERAGAEWLPGATVAAALRSLRRLDRIDVIVSHMTAADIAAVLFGGRRRVPVVSTRHFAATRGRSFVARRIGAWLLPRLAGQLCGSEFIAANIEGAATVVPPGVEPVDDDGSARTPVVLVAQRLEAEKDTETALRAWAAIDDHRGWRLVIAGSGVERDSLEHLSRELGIADVVDFAGFVTDVDGQLRRSAIFLATAPAEPFGLSVVEAMAHGVPVVAARGGGHIETAGAVEGAELFTPGDAADAAARLERLMRDQSTRDRYGEALRLRQQTEFDAATQGRAILAAVLDFAERWRSVHPSRPILSTGERAVNAVAGGVGTGIRLIVVSLEAWDEVWRRNQYLVDGLLNTNPDLEVLFVEPPSDPVHALRRGQRPRPGLGLRSASEYGGRLKLHQPTKLLPRVVGPFADTLLLASIRRATRRLGWRKGVLWINDPSASGLVSALGWPALYDITDDWVQADRGGREHARLREADAELLDKCGAVIVCSPGLERTKGAVRPVVLIPNAVDVARYRRPYARPTDLPDTPVALYAGTLHEDRLDVDLVLETASAAGAAGGSVVLVGPIALSDGNRVRLSAHPAIVMLGSRSRDDVPAYLQHAHTLIVPHIVDDFTESLDPIKLYEYLAVGRPVVSTPVAGFRGEPSVTVAARESFPETVTERLAAWTPSVTDLDVPDWSDRVTAMRSVIDSIAGGVA
jgi:glycosyltransferase involved in cell wall biosynthesis